jgi:peptidoglycan-associated lipoprotein
MTRRHKTLSSVILAVLATLTLAACQPKRPPAVATGPGAGTTPATKPPSSTRPDSIVDGGPDLQPVDREGATGVELSDAQTGEGGPLADIRYDFDQAKLSDEARALLEQHAAWLKRHGDTRVTVEGHCDERGTVEYNLALGDQRAKAARDYLVSLGIAAERLTAVSYGKERPLDPDHNEDAWAKNRRAHFRVTK